MHIQDLPVAVFSVELQYKEGGLLDEIRFASH